MKIESAISNDEFETWTVIADAQVDVVSCGRRRRSTTPISSRSQDLADEYIVSEGLAEPE
ncbi:MAG: hypothetical protein ACOX4T_10920 [Acetivibrionales bacterium]